MAAANTDKLKKYKSLFSTTLSTGIGTGTSDTITPASVSGLPTDTAITLTFDRVDSGGVATPTKLERIVGVISGGNFTSYVRGIDGTTEQAHTAGAVIEMVWNADDLNDMVDWGIVEHNQDGTHAATIVKTTGTQTLTDKTLTSPVINTGFSGTAKATGAEVDTGTEDAKIVTPKAMEDSSYAKTAAIPVKASGAEITTGTDDAKFVTAKALADATTGKLGAAWVTFTPTWTYVTPGTGSTSVGRYMQIGKLIHFHAKLILGTSPTMGAITLAPPVTISTDYEQYTALGTVILNDSSTLYHGFWYNTVGYIDAWTVNGTKIVHSTISSTNPFTWAAGDFITISGSYIAA